MDKILQIIKKIIPKRLFKMLQPIYHFLLSWFSAVVYRFPSKKLIVIGVTGTTGKTTTVYFIARVLESAGFKVGLTSTAMFSDGKNEWLNNKKMTMVGRLFTQKILRRMVNNGCQYAIVESTSEGMAQFRHRFINYDILVFTGLYPEHIDSHGSFENYKQAKAKLFKHLQYCQIKYADEKGAIKKSEAGLKKISLNRVNKYIIINGDDEYAEYFFNFFANKKIIYTKKSKINFDFKGEAELVRIDEIKSGDWGISFSAIKKRINLKILGEFNAGNAAAAIAIGLSQNINFDRIKFGLEEIKGIPGRLERVNEGQDFIVIVDYAFEPEAVAKLYGVIKNISHNKVIHVLGATGGGRDIARRPKLGKLAGKNADYVIVANEDPYDDDPDIIIDQVALGAENAGKKQKIDLFKINDREQAIKKALALAKTGDLILITGKGSEQAICVANGKKISWDDRKVVKRLLLNKK
ncbi:MAG: UDP-N-acetylmuramyl-tripeptide synthetase [Patescibacteria group bacterium]|nr:UDP-N-acetylmuramyl-tripeptide synthetase [Patescibacteria group bacterium]